MKFVALSAWLIFLTAVTCAARSPVNADDPRLEQSRVLVQTFGAQLKGELQKALQQGGPVTAVRVCKDVAPQIASELSRQSGARVMRTSLRYRNPGNAPEAWQARVLTEFEAVATAQETAAPLEYFATEKDGTARYMSAIRIDAVCLACHGEALRSDLQQSLEQDYPHDRATGYAAGDMRGAFSVSWPPDK